MRALLRLAAAASLAASLLLGGGFVWFVHDASRVRPIPPDADGIVVLTGGALRVETGLALLDAGVAPRLLVSGVGGGVTTQSLIDASGDGGDRATDHGDLVLRANPVLYHEPSPRSIVLGRGARSTVDNAVETASWAREEGLRTLVVVTAGYHMRRALAAIGAMLPDVTLRPYPVHPAAPLRLLALEYLKLVAVECDLVPMPDTVATT